MPPTFKKKELDGIGFLDIRCYDCTPDSKLGSLGPQAVALPIEPTLLGRFSHLVYLFSHIF